MNPSLYKKIAAGFGLAVAGIGTIVLIGWFLGLRMLTSIRPDYIPMAPNTALLFLLLGAGLVSLASERRSIARCARVAASFVIAIAFLRFMEYTTPVQLDVDRWIFKFPSQNLTLAQDAPLAPAGRMAFFTALNFVCAAIALLLLAFSARRRPSLPWATAFAIITLLIGLTFTLGYAYGAPLLYGGTTIPMALNTSTAFVLSGAGLLMIASGREAAEQKRAREELQTAHDELERRVHERTKDLAAANEALGVKIGEHSRAEQALREAHDMLTAVIHASPMAMAITDLDGNVRMWNPAAERIFGWREEEVLGRPLPTVPPDKREERRSLDERALRNEALAGLELIRQRKDGSLIDISLSTAPLHDVKTGICGILSIMADITERRHLEEQLRQAQKLESLGLLAGGVAHDFNNLLNGIIGFTELALREVAPDSKVHRYLSRVPELGRQAADLIAQLLAFARKAPLERKPMDLNLLLRETGKILRRTIPESIAIEVAPASEPLVVQADLAQVQQILLNLSTNARDAMPKGGRLSLRLAPVTIGQEGLGEHPDRRQGRFACLTVADTGTGIPAAIRDRIFEPFFTTKESGKGTGLGLSSAHGIVHQHDGWMEVETAEGQGTAFHVFLPLLSIPAAAPRSVGEAIPRGVETVLLVEDNPMVRELGETLLTQLGYTVLVAADGIEALEAFRAHPEIALAVTDAVMPRMGAVDLIPSLRALNPAIKVLVATGYAPEQIRTTLEHLQLSGHIQKPFRLAELAQAVRSALDQPAPPARGHQSQLFLALQSRVTPFFQPTIGYRLTNTLELVGHTDSSCSEKPQWKNSSSPSRFIELRGSWSAGR